jgi:periplasmic divalent cation tolerance protein
MRFGLTGNPLEVFMDEVCVLFVTVPNPETGQRIARELVNTRLAACVNRIPGLCSIYQWQGKVEESAEELLMIKTRKSLVEAVTAKVKSMHPYQVPEVIAVPIVGGFGPYLQWIREETRLSAE